MYIFQIDHRIGEEQGLLAFRHDYTYKVPILFHVLQNIKSFIYQMSMFNAECLNSRMLFIFI